MLGATVVAFLGRNPRLMFLKALRIELYECTHGTQSHRYTPPQPFEASLHVTMELRCKSIGRALRPQCRAPSQLGHAIHYHVHELCCKIAGTQKHRPGHLRASSPGSREGRRQSFTDKSRRMSRKLRMDFVLGHVFALGRLGCLGVLGLEAFRDFGMYAFRVLGF